MSGSLFVIPVRGFPGYFVSLEGLIYKFITEEKCSYYKPVSQHTNHGGYSVVHLNKKKKLHTKRVHILVWTSFIGKVPRGYQINHSFGVKSDNGLLSLDLMTQAQNLKHSREIGLRQKPKIEKKLDEFQILTMYTLKKSHTRKSLVEYSGTTIRNVEMILAGQTWKKLFQAIMPLRKLSNGRKYAYRSDSGNSSKEFIATEKISSLRDYIS